MGNERSPRSPRQRRSKVCRWIRNGLSALERHPHVRACLLCKEILDQCAVADEAYAAEAARKIMEHVQAHGEKGPDLSCQYAGCLQHETVPLAFARALLRVGNGDRPWRDARGILVGTIALKATAEEHPPGWDLKAQDAVHRAFPHLPMSAGNIYVRIGPKRCQVHIWACPWYTSRRADILDPVALWQVREFHEQHMPALREWCLARYAEVKDLTDMDLQFAQPGPE